MAPIKVALASLLIEIKPAPVKPSTPSITAVMVDVPLTCNVAVPPALSNVILSDVTELFIVNVVPVAIIILPSLFSCLPNSYLLTVVSPLIY